MRQSVQFHQSNDFFVSFRIVEKFLSINAVFKTHWLYDESFKVWLKKDDKDINSAFCKVCCKSFSIGNGGIENLKQHAKGKKHEARCPAPGRTIRVVKSLEKHNNQEKETVKNQANMISREQTMKAEIILALEVLKCKYLYCSCE